MPRTDIPTRDRIVSAAAKLFYDEGVRSVSVDAIASQAGVTKRTLYYHFDSKDELVAAYLEGRDNPNFALFQRWFAATEGSLADKVRGIFANLARSARHPRWKGCGFLRTSVELAATPGHPAMKVAAAHKGRVEAWLRTCFEAEDLRNAGRLARQVMLLLDGSFAVVLLHRDPSYMDAAGEAAHLLIGTALDARETS